MQMSSYWGSGTAVGKITYSSVALCHWHWSDRMCNLFGFKTCIWHSRHFLILLCKLRAAGCSEKALLWFKPYLCDRSQKVNFNSSFADTRSTFAGVPQGSILGPLLFLIMVNGLPSVLKHCKLTMYADDTTLYICGVDNGVLQIKIQEDLDRISVWLAQNKLSLILTRLISWF